MNRQKAIDYIEGMAGCYRAVWHEWLDKDIEALYICICTKVYEREFTEEDAERLKD